jgi:acyl carrier protein
MAIREEIEKYISELTNNPEIDHSLNLFESGLLTSLDVLDLISFIENEYDIGISDEDLGMENFGSIDRIVKYLENAKCQK